MAGSKLSLSHEETLHSLVVLDHPAEEREIPSMAMISLTASWSRMTVLLMMSGDVYFFVTRGWIPNWRARRAMEIMAGRESWLLFGDCLDDMVSSSDFLCIENVE